MDVKIIFLHGDQLGVSIHDHLVEDSFQIEKNMDQLHHESAQDCALPFCLVALKPHDLIVVPPKDSPMVEQELPSTLHFMRPNESLPLTIFPNHLENDETSNEYITNEGIGRSLEDILGERPIFCSPDVSDKQNKALDLVPIHQPIGWKVWTDDLDNNPATTETFLLLRNCSQTLEWFELFHFDPLTQTPLRPIHEPLISSDALCEGGPHMRILAPCGVMFPFQVH